MWIPPEEKNPILLHHPTRKSVGYFGTVRLRDGKFVYQREMMKIFSYFLKLSEKEYPEPSARLS